MIHGDEMQCHNQFMDCIKQLYWQRILYPGPDEQANLKMIQLFHLPFAEEIDRWHDLVANDLKNKLQIYKDKPLDIYKEINRQAHEAFPILLFDSIYSSEWLECGKDLVCERFLKFWNQWPTSKSQHPLIVCLLIKYTPIHIPIWKRWLKKTKDPNDDLKNNILPKKMGAYCNIIPELKNISYEETYPPFNVIMKPIPRITMQILFLWML